MSSSDRAAAHRWQFDGNGRVARFAIRHRLVKKLLWRLGLLPNVLGPAYNLRWNR